MASRKFIEPMLPTLVKSVPGSGDWIHEIKFDGWRGQVHIEDGAARVFSRNGADLTRRFVRLAPALSALPVKQAVIDCELVACDEAGLPCFETLMRLGGRAPALAVMAFDLLFENGEDLMRSSVEARKKRLAAIVKRACRPEVQFSAPFDDVKALLATLDGMGFEGVVSKRRGSLTGPERQKIG